MPREIWNEGRVVGESAYEIYVKQHLAEDPNSPPATEREWLASSLAMGASMVLKMPYVYTTNPDGLTYVNIKLPHNSNLAAANTIVASYFTGEAEFPENDSEHPDDDMWATKITDYGVLISNNSVGSPDTGYVGPDASQTTGMPTQVLAKVKLDLDAVRDYMHIIDGVVIQPGNWFETSSYPPSKDFTPDLTDTCTRIRLLVRGNINTNPLILLTGFTLNSVLSGCVGTEGSTTTAHPENGDFLGPAEFPWAAKIVFSVPNIFLQYNLGMTYVRTLVDSAEVKDNAIVDMVATDPKDYYADYDSVKWSLYHPVTVPIPGSSDVEVKNPKYPYYVSKVTPPVDAASATLTVFTKPSGPYYPPALWGTRITSAGNTALYPLDVVAPGTIKMFNNIHAGVLQDYQLNFPGTWAMNHTNDNHIQILDDSDPENPQFVTLANQGDTSVSSVKLTNNNTVFDTPFKTYDASSNHPRMMQVQVGSTKGYGLMLSSNGAASSPTPYTISAVPSSSLNVTHSTTHDSTTYTPDDNLAWSTLLNALIEDKSINLLGDKLKFNKYSLQKPNTYDTSDSTAKANWKKTQLEHLYETSSGTAHVQIGGRNFYVSTRAPYIKDDVDGTSIDEIPNGSISTGWGPYVYMKRTSKAISGELQFHRWIPFLGGEYKFGVLHYPATAETSNEITIPGFWSGLVIVGRNIDVNGNAIYLKDIFAGTTTEGTTHFPTIAWFSRWDDGVNPLYICKHSDFDVYLDSSHGLHIRTQYGSSEHPDYCEYMVVGNMYKDYNYDTNDDNTYEI